MILLFGEKASKSSSSNKTNNVKNHPVENSGILAMNASEAKSLLSMGEYDTYVFSNPTAIDYSMYSDSDYSSNESGFMSEFSSAVAFLGDCGFSTGASFDGGCSSSCSSGSFASVC